MVYECHQLNLPAARRRPTVVLPRNEGPVLRWIILHELGHALHETLGWEWTAKPVNEYAKTDRHEAFACALTAWFDPEEEPLLYENDPATAAYFDRFREAA